MAKYILINDMEVGKTYRHFKNKQMIVTVDSRFETDRGLHLILKHVWVDQLQVCLAKTYDKSKWEEIR